MNILSSIESLLFTRRVAAPVLDSHIAINDSILALANIIDKVVLHGECKKLAILALHEVQQYAIVGATLDQAQKGVTELSNVITNKPMQEVSTQPTFSQTPINYTTTQQNNQGTSSPEMTYDNNI